MLETYVWMALLLSINWGGFIWLILRAMTKERKHGDNS